MIIQPDQIRAARALLRLEQAEVAQRAGVSVVTIRRLESEGGQTRVAEATLADVRRVLEQEVAEFIPGGVRRRAMPAPGYKERYEALLAISLRSAAELQGRDDLLTDDGLYDENGLPA
jgi:transcriptional regulator with XRE-family HTH domain